jgi:hypothetical protein
MVRTFIIIVMLSTLAFSGYFLYFGTDDGIKLGYQEDWYSMWGGVPYSGFKLEKSWEIFDASFELSSRLFEKNTPGTSELSFGFLTHAMRFELFGGFSTEEATTVGDSELVGGVFIGGEAELGNNPSLILKLSSTIYGLYRKNLRYYFGFAPFGDLNMFPLMISLGVKYKYSNSTIYIMYSFRTGTAPGIPTPVFDIGGVMLRIKILR